MRLDGFMKKMNPNYEPSEEKLKEKLKECERGFVEVFKKKPKRRTSQLLTIYSNIFNPELTEELFA